MQHHARIIQICWILAGGMLVVGCANPSTDEWQDRLESYVEHELQQQEIPSLALTIVEGNAFEWSRGFGQAPDTVSGVTVFRAASVSKLFTAMAVMQLAEQGVVSLDAPVTDYLAEFRPHNLFEQPVTLRQLLSHQSGMVREPPVGHYFDDTDPGLKATVESLHGTSLTTPPASGTKYSNAAVSVAGYVVEQMSGQPFEAYVQEHIIDILQLSSTSFSARPDLRARLGTGYMWRYDTATLTRAPVFELGMGPAANLYTTTADLGRFARALFAIERDELPDILSAASLRTMWTPQFTAQSPDHGFGLGFHVTSQDSWRMVGHAGAMYGYATRIWVIPERQLAVAAVATVDAANAVVDRIAHYALSLKLAEQEQAALPEAEQAVPVDSALARHLDGTYQHGGATLRLVERDSRLFMDFDALRYELRMQGDHLVNYGRLGSGHLALHPLGDTLRVNTESWVRQPAAVPPRVPSALVDYIGEYGWDHNVLYIYEDKGALHALIEWFFRYPLEQAGPDTFRFPDHGLYHHEGLTFVRDADGQVTEANLSGVAFKKRGTGQAPGSTFRIVPQIPVDQLRAKAAVASPPDATGAFRAPDLVPVTAMDSTIRLDIRYATDNNFMGAPFYRSAQAFLQRPAAEALAVASRRLAAYGYGLVVYDGYRPWHVTKMFWDATPDSLRLFVANPQNGSRHNRGCAIDVGLYHLASGALAEMPSGYDEFTARAFPDYPGGTSRGRYHRELLRDAMEESGFTVYAAEWWHFDYKDWRAYPILNDTFEALD